MKEKKREFNLFVYLPFLVVQEILEFHYLLFHLDDLLDLVDPACPRVLLVLSNPVLLENPAIPKVQSFQNLQFRFCTRRTR